MAETIVTLSSVLSVLLIVAQYYISIAGWRRDDGMMCISTVIAILSMILVTVLGLTARSTMGV